MGQIYLENIRTYSHHGCMQEETIIGSEYRVDLWVDADLSVAAQTDNLNDTPDYVLLHEIVVSEMKTASKLLEHVAQRIIDQINRKFASLEKVKVRVTKINPPIGGDVQSVSVLLSS